jgi:putative membrane protein
MIIDQAMIGGEAVGWHMDDWAWWNWAVMTMVMFGLWGLIAWLVVLAVRPARRQAPPPRAEEILAERFAAGEIDDAEYRRRLDVIREGADRF